MFLEINQAAVCTVGGNTMLMSRIEAAKFLGVSTRTLDRRAAEGKIRYISSCRGGRIHYRDSDLERYIKENTHEGRRL